MDVTQALQELTLEELSHGKQPEEVNVLRKRFRREELEGILSPEVLCLLYTPEKFYQLYPPVELDQFKEIAEEEKVRITGEKLPRGKKSYTPEELCQTLTPEELYHIFTAEELRQMFTPEQLLEMFTPEQLCQVFTGSELCGMFTFARLRRMFTRAQLSLMTFPMG